jgi:RimJ/RimL family protein N-acetyltransferase
MDYRIVPIAEKHFKGLRGVVDAVARERRYLAMLRGFSLKDTRDFVRARMKERSPYFVALAGGRVVGWCDIQPVPRDTMKHGGVLGMGIVDGFCSQGIGSALLRATLARARERGFTRVELTVRADNRRAIWLYRKFGFVREGVKRSAFRVAGRYYDLYSMAVLFKGSKT